MLHGSFFLNTYSPSLHLTSSKAYSALGGKSDDYRFNHEKTKIQRGRLGPKNGDWKFETKPVCEAQSNYSCTQHCLRVACSFL